MRHFFRAVRFRRGVVLLAPVALLALLGGLVLHPDGGGRLRVTPDGVIEDTNLPASFGTVTYLGTWPACTVSCGVTTANGSYHYSSGAGHQIILRCTCQQITWDAIQEPDGGQANITVDGNAAGSVDLYSPTKQAMTVWESAVLTSGPHAILITTTGQKQPASSGSVVTFDKAQVFISSTAGPIASSTTAIGAGPRSNLPWLSGVNADPDNTVGDVNGFASWRGTPADTVNIFTDRTSWDNIVGETFSEDNFEGSGLRLVIAVPPFPSGIGATYAACDSGSYDSEWNEFGTTLVSTGFPNAIVRLGWEFNGDYDYWSPHSAGGTTAQYVSCYDKIATDIRLTDPAVVMDWTVNAHGTPADDCGGSVITCYPGDAYVDVVSIDNYDEYPPSTGGTLNQGIAKPFATIASANEGITYMYNFALSHNKFFGVGEWGVVTYNNGNSAGDNPSYIDNMKAWFVAHDQASGGKLLYENYFSNCDAGNVLSGFYPTTCGPTNSAARYKADF